MTFNIGALPFVLAVLLLSVIVWRQRGWRSLGTGNGCSAGVGRS